MPLYQKRLKLKFNTLSLLCVVPEGDSLKYITKLFFQKPVLSQLQLEEYSNHRSGLQGCPALPLTKRVRQSVLSRPSPSLT